MVKYNVTGRELICSFHERLDTLACSEIEEKLIEMINESQKKVIFDLQGIEYIASAFLRICIKTGKIKGTENFSIVNVTPTVKKVFKIADLDKIFKIR